MARTIVLIAATTLTFATSFVPNVASAQQVQPSSVSAPAADIVAPPFDVISVRPSQDNRTRMQLTLDGWHGNGVTVQFLLFEGFGGIGKNQIIGEPSWSSTDGFDIDAKVAAADVPTFGKMNFDQRRAMFKDILTERFKLAVHHETRELPIYNLVVAKDGPKFKESVPGDPASPRRRGMMSNPGKMTGTEAQISTLVTLLSRQLGRPIIDKTGLTKNYDFTLEWTPDNGAAPTAAGAAASAPTPDQSGPDIFTAIQEQLGLKLESAKGPVDVIVIDHIEKPAGN